MTSTFSSVFVQRQILTHGGMQSHNKLWARAQCYKSKLTANNLKGGPELMAQIAHRVLSRTYLGLALWLVMWLAQLGHVRSRVQWAASGHTAGTSGCRTRY